MVLPRIQALVAAGMGPTAVVTGSRGGQVTIVKLWEFWRGPSVVLNGADHRMARAPPPGVDLGLMCAGQDFFDTRDPDLVQARCYQFRD